MTTVGSWAEKVATHFFTFACCDGDSLLRYSLL